MITNTLTLTTELLQQARPRTDVDQINITNKLVLEEEDFNDDDTLSTFMTLFRQHSSCHTIAFKDAPDAKVCQLILKAINFSLIANELPCLEAITIESDLNNTALTAIKQATFPDDIVLSLKINTATTQTVGKLFQSPALNWTNCFSFQAIQCSVVEHFCKVFVGEKQPLNLVFSLEHGNGDIDIDTDKINQMLVTITLFCLQHYQQLDRLILCYTTNNQSFDFSAQRFLAALKKMHPEEKNFYISKINALYQQPLTATESSFFDLLTNSAQHWPIFNNSPLWFLSNQSDTENNEPSISRLTQQPSQTSAILSIEPVSRRPANQNLAPARNNIVEQTFFALQNQYQNHELLIATVETSWLTLTTQNHKNANPTEQRFLTEAAEKSAKYALKAQQILMDYDEKSLEDAAQIGGIRINGKTYTTQNRQNNTIVYLAFHQIKNQCEVHPKLLRLLVWALWSHLIQPFQTILEDHRELLTEAITLTIKRVKETLNSLKNKQQRPNNPLLQKKQARASLPFVIRERPELQSILTNVVTRLTFRQLLEEEPHIDANTLAELVIEEWTTITAQHQNERRIDEKFLYQQVNKMSTSQDSTENAALEQVKLKQIAHKWDTRSVEPLATAPEEEKTILCLAIMLLTKRVKHKIDTPPSKNNDQQKNHQPPPTRAQEKQQVLRNVQAILEAINNASYFDKISNPIKQKYNSLCQFVRLFNGVLSNRKTESSIMIVDNGDDTLLSQQIIQCNEQLIFSTNKPEKIRLIKQFFIHYLIDHTPSLINNICIDINNTKIHCDKMFGNVTDFSDKHDSASKQGTAYQLQPATEGNFTPESEYPLLLSDPSRRSPNIEIIQQILDGIDNSDTLYSSSTEEKQRFSALHQLVLKINQSQDKKQAITINYDGDDLHMLKLTLSCTDDLIDTYRPKRRTSIIKNFIITCMKYIENNVLANIHQIEIQFETDTVDLKPCFNEIEAVFHKNKKRPSSSINSPNQPRQKKQRHQAPTHFSINRQPPHVATSLQHDDDEDQPENVIIKPTTSQSTPKKNNASCLEINYPTEKTLSQIAGQNTPTWAKKIKLMADNLDIVNYFCKLLLETEQPLTIEIKMPLKHNLAFKATLSIITALLLKNYTIITGFSLINDKTDVNTFNFSTFIHKLRALTDQQKIILSDIADNLHEAMFDPDINFAEKVINECRQDFLANTPCHIKLAPEKTNHKRQRTLDFSNPTLQPRSKKQDNRQHNFSDKRSDTNNQQNNAELSNIITTFAFAQLMADPSFDSAQATILINKAWQEIITNDNNPKYIAFQKRAAKRLLPNIEKSYNARCNTSPGEIKKNINDNNTNQITHLLYLAFIEKNPKTQTNLLQTIIAATWQQTITILPLTARNSIRQFLRSTANLVAERVTGTLTLNIEDEETNNCFTF
jgi:hypothetical protein